MSSLASSRAGSQTALRLAFGITAAVLIAEVVGGLLTNSLALVADAGHVGSDLVAMVLAMVALMLAARPASRRRTYGFHRAEVLAALANGFALIVVAAYVIWEASRRLGDAPEVNSGPMLAVASLGLVANVGVALALSRHASSSLNVQAAFLHVLGDAAASVGVVIAGVIMLATGEYIVDPLISMLIAALIVLSALRLIWQTTQVLMEATPPGLNVRALQDAMLRTEGVTEVHDLHVWTVTSGFISLSGHVQTEDQADQHETLVNLRRLLAHDFDIQHATIQLESSVLHEELETCCGVDSESHAAEHIALHR